MAHEKISELRKLQTDFSDWLGGSTFAWSHFVHLSFSKTPGRSAITHACAFFLALSRDLGRDPTVAFVAMEFGPEGGRGHVHAIAELPGVASRFIKSEWERQYGWAKVEPYNPKLGGLHYVTKYVIKDACITAEWRLLPTPEDRPDDDLFKAASRRTGYQLYARWVAFCDEKGADKWGSSKISPAG